MSVYKSVIDKVTQKFHDEHLVRMTAGGNANRVRDEALTLAQREAGRTGQPPLGFKTDMQRALEALAQKGIYRPEDVPNQGPVAEPLPAQLGPSVQPVQGPPGPFQQEVEQRAAERASTPYQDPISRLGYNLPRYNREAGQQIAGVAAAATAFDTPSLLVRGYNAIPGAPDVPMPGIQEDLQRRQQFGEQNLGPVFEPTTLATLPLAAPASGSLATRLLIAEALNVAPDLAAGRTDKGTLIFDAILGALPVAPDIAMAAKNGMPEAISALKRWADNPENQKIVQRLAGEAGGPGETPEELIRASQAAAKADEGIVPAVPSPPSPQVGQLLDEEGNLLPVAAKGKPDMTPVIRDPARPNEPIPLTREVNLQPEAPDQLIKGAPLQPKTTEPPTFYDVDEAPADFWGRQAKKIDTEIPDRTKAGAIRERLPELRQYEAQEAQAKQVLASAQTRLSELEQQYSQQVEPRRALGIYRRVSGSKTAPPENMVTDKMLAEARRDVREAGRVAGKAQDATRNLADVFVTKEDVMARAREAGASENLVQTMGRSYEIGADVTQNARRFIEGGGGKQSLARLRALAEGDTPDQFVNAVMESRFNLGSALHADTEKWTREIAPALNRVLSPKGLKDLDYVGPNRMIDLVAEYPEIAVVSHPEWFRGFSKEQKALLDVVDGWQKRRYALMRAVDQKAKPALDRPYLENIWEFAQGKGVQPQDLTLRPFGRAGTTKARAWTDPFEAMTSGKWEGKLKHMSVGEYIEHSANLTNRQLATQYERKLVLARFGSRTPGAGKLMPKNPAYAGWYLPSDMANWIDQVHESASSLTRGATKITQPFLNTVLGAGLDLAAVGRNTVELMGSQGVATTLGAVNRALMLVGRGVDLYGGSGLSRKTVQALDGLPVRSGESSFVRPEAGTLLQYVPGAKRLDKGLSTAMDTVNRFQYDTVLGEARGFAYEGRLLLAKLFGKNIDDPSVRRAAMSSTLTWSGGSRGAIREGRRAAERGFLGAPGITRSMVAQVASLTNLRNPISDEGLQTLVTLANVGVTLYAAKAATEYARTGELPDPRKVFDPREVDWATVRVGGKTVMVDGKPTLVGGRNVPILPDRGLIRAIGKSMQAIEDGKYERIGDAWTQLGYTRLTPAIQAGVTWPTGMGFTKEGRFTKDLSVKERAIGTTPIPLNVRQAVESGASGELGPADIALAQLGTSIFPGPTEEQAFKTADKAKKSKAESALRGTGFDQIEPQVFKQFQQAGYIPPKYDNCEDWRKAVKQEIEKQLREQNIPTYYADQYMQQIPTFGQYNRAVRQYEDAFIQQHPEIQTQIYEAGIREP